MGTAQEIGRMAEDAAADYLAASDFVIRSRNWREGRYELDIVAEKGGILHFVEVKCRKDGGLTRPEEAMTQSKFNSLLKAARAYIACNNIESEIQFDLVCVLHNDGKTEVVYYPDVMYCRW